MSDAGSQGGSQEDPNPLADARRIYEGIAGEAVCQAEVEREQARMQGPIANHWSPDAV